MPSAEGGRRKIRINRAHLEEDAGKNIHDESGKGGDSQVDLNRCGTPLLEIVSEPDLRSAAEAKAYLEELHLLLTYLGVSDCNMQEGSLRCDANVNVHLQQDGETVATPIVEIKNLNSFRGVEAAIEFEVRRQIDEYAKTGRKLGDPGVEKETRGWNADRGVSFAQRGKEEASDYRYFPDPDLVPVTVTEEQLAEIREELREFPAVRRSRFESEYGLAEYDASVIINQGTELADYYEQAARKGGDGKQAANWVTQTVLRELKERACDIENFPVDADVLGALVRRIVEGVITVKSGREVFDLLLEGAEQGTAPQRRAYRRDYRRAGTRRHVRSCGVGRAHRRGRRAESEGRSRRPSRKTPGRRTAHRQRHAEPQRRRSATGPPADHRAAAGLVDRLSDKRCIKIEHGWPGG